MKPYFNDFVVHKGHAYGFDGSILSCIDLQDGKRKWKGGRFGDGQLVLLPDQDLLLVVSEEGDLALVKATPDQFTEIARFKAIEGKTWNHPVIVRDVLLVRNGEEMAAYRLSLAARSMYPAAQVTELPRKQIALPRQAHLPAANSDVAPETPPGPWSPPRLRTCPRPSTRERALARPA